MAEINDILGFGKLGSELLDKLGKAIGYIFKPTHIKRIAKAQSDAIQEIKKNNPEAQIEISNEDIKISIVGNDNLMANVVSIVGQELKKQENINEIVELTLEQLKGVQDESKDIDLDDDWINHFFESAKFSSDEDMKILWSKILYDECLNKGSYSLRTIDFLKTMSKSEAQLFTKACKNSFLTNGERVLVNFNECQDDYDIHIIDIVKLSDIGLINDPAKSVNSTLSPAQLQFIKDDKVYIISSNNKITVPINLFSSVGNELAKLVQDTREFLEDENLLKKIFSLSKSRSLTVHQLINTLQDGQIQYLATPIKTIIINN